MKIDLSLTHGVSLAELISDKIEIRSTEDILDLIGNCSYQGAKGIILHHKNIIPEFFDLKTGLAGDMLQKFSTYGMKLSIVGDFSDYKSKSLNDFIYESNKSGKINFVKSLEEAKEILMKD